MKRRLNHIQSAWYSDEHRQVSKQNLCQQEKESIRNNIAMGYKKSLYVNKQQAEEYIIFSYQIFLIFTASIPMSEYPH